MAVVLVFHHLYTLVTVVAGSDSIPVDALTVQLDFFT